MGEFEITESADINYFETDDIEDLTMAGLGTVGVEAIPLFPFIIILIFVSVLLYIFLFTDFLTLKVKKG